ncbi:MAG: rhodanese-like domain-containing protein [Archangiaceae bacterium]|nr:rhodanese-like domain-containing protein [Archangiaceae bacterium]
MSSQTLQWLIPVALVALFLLFKRLTQVSPDEARRLVKEGARLIDVRSAAEFASGHLPGAINVPVQELSARLDKLGPKDEPKVVYCASGTRSAVARSMLKGHGFARVFNLGAMSRS